MLAYGAVRAQEAVTSTVVFASTTSPSSATSTNRLGVWLSMAYSDLSAAKSIVTSGVPSKTSSASASPTTGTASLAQPGGSSPTSASSPGTSGSSHHNNTLVIALGVVFGALALGLIVLALVCCCKRRGNRRKSRRVLTPDDDEVDSWRGSEPNRDYTPLAPGSSDGRPISHHYPAEAPPMAQHPAMRHENPFVPVPPAPRRGAPNARAGLTDAAVPGQDPFIAPSSQPHGGILRKSPSHSRERGGVDLRDSYDQPIPAPLRGNSYHEDVQANNGYRQADPSMDLANNRASVHEQPYNDPLPTRYNQDRPATPFGLFGAGAAGATAGAAGAGLAAHHHHEHENRDYNSNRRYSTSGSSNGHRSLDAPPPRPAGTPPLVPSRSPKRARFSDSPPINISSHSGSEAPSSPNRAHFSDSPVYNSSNSRSDSGDSTWRLSSQMPGAWDSPRHSYQGTTPRSSYSGGAGGQGRRLRLSDLQRQEQEWYDQNHEQGYGVGQAM